ncbi:hypothetical protein GIB67_027479 [Kingdonia uniflora]|uniref:Glycosyl transferase CAP10 domain-containing protein n=1 Tax=Kingdonia uniflora TaxID=39325 RepID=A0A7J7MFL9_9MAGN|nr:hypothetical protein GIB67_027479 [Kingdonia uniflora]
MVISLRTTRSGSRRSRLSSSKILSRAPRRLFILVVFAILALYFGTVFVLNKVEEIVFNTKTLASKTKTLAGHNLDPTPWHRFPPKVFGDSSYRKASNLIKCSYLSCPKNPEKQNVPSYLDRNTSAKCPPFYRWIHHDLEPWAQTRISHSKLMEAQPLAAFRVVIVKGRLYVDYYYACVQTRTMFTIWGLLQLLKRYPGMIPDVDLMFDCMDKPFVTRSKYRPESKRWPPPPLFRYCTTEGHYDMPFPDWSFWGWAEIHIKPWDQEFRSIKKGSQAETWADKSPHAYWKGNPDVGSRVRTMLLRCNGTKQWGAEIMRQNWLQEGRSGFKQSKLANQCKHRYKIYAEGSAWSVSLKYIVSCGSTSLIISSQYEDFFTRGLVPKKNYWPVSPNSNLCRSIKFAVDWGNSNPSQAEAIGKGGQNLMKNLPMERIYDYMYHLIKEYAKLQDFKPAPPESAQEVCAESVLCFADSSQRQYLEMSATTPSSSPPCTLPPADHNLIESWVQKKKRVISDVQKLETIA